MFIINNLDISWKISIFEPVNKKAKGCQLHFIRESYDCYINAAENEILDIN